MDGYYMTSHPSQFNYVQYYRRWCAIVPGSCDCIILLHHCAGEWIEWCGFLVNTSTLDVKINLSRYTSTGIDDTGDHTDTVSSTMS